MSFDFREELRLRTLKVCNHPADKCYSSVFQRPPPYKSDNNEKEKGINGLAPPLGVLPNMVCAAPNGMVFQPF